MKIPHKIRITAKTSYEVVWVDSFDDPKQMGECRGDTRQIMILNGMNDKDTMETLIHEVLHALEFEWKIPIPHKCVHLLEKAILKLLRLNGWMPST